MKTTTHIGDLVAQAGVEYDFTSITGYLDCSKADAETKFPKLATVGGGAHFRGWTGSAPKLATIGRDAYFRGWRHFRKGIKTNDPIALKLALAKQGLVLVDGILAKLVAKRGPVSRVIIVGKTVVSYIVERDGKTAHGATLAEARSDLILKLGTRDTSQFKEWTLETKTTLEEMIVAYRTITGACNQGVSLFLASKKLPPKFTVAFAIDQTKGAYEAETFRNFFTK
jgi:hypothetical protein